MHFSDSIQLVTITEADTSLATAIAAGTKVTVFADKQSVRQSEFYQAAATGMRPEIVFVVWTAEYSNQALVIDGSTNYKVLRTYSRPDEKTELVCFKL